MMLTDEYLMALVKGERNHEALAELFRRHHDGVLNFLTRFSADAIAEDLAQETFIAAWRFGNLYQDGSSVKNWLMKVAANRWKNHRQTLSVA
jgi:RNA polymerase sigma-70 factor (ECF subfamily)